MVKPSFFCHMPPVSIQSYRAHIHQEKHAAILSAAFDVFASQGFAGAGMAEIARNADVSTATLYKHFASKDELFGEIAITHIAPYHEAAEELIPTLHLSEEPVAALSTLSGSFANLLSNPQTAALFRLIIAEGERFPDLKDVIYRHGRDPFKARLVELLEAFKQRELIAIAEPSAAAEFYIGMLTYWLLFAPMFNQEIHFAKERVDHIIRESALMFLTRFEATPGAILAQSDYSPSLRLK